MTRVSFIVHGCVWPDVAARQALEQRLRSVVPDAQVLEAAEDRRSPRGAAHAINRAAGQATGERLVVLEPFSDVTSDELRHVIDLAERALVTIGQSDVVPGVSPARAFLTRAGAVHGGGPADLLGSILQESEALEQALTAAAIAPIDVWALPRARFQEAGGLDARLWSIGVLRDLAVRLEGRLPVITRGPVSAGTRSAWPLQPDVARLLATRNHLITAFKSLHAHDLGIELAHLAVLELRRAWAASGLRHEDFQFGGPWGRNESTLARALRPGAHGAAHLESRAQVLLPLLALDSFLDVVPALLGDRRTHTGSRASTDEAESSRDNPEPEASGLRPSGEPAAPALQPEGQATWPRVSVIIVNWNGRDHLGPCLSSLLASDYPVDRLEILCVDNGSTDGSLELLQREFPTVGVVALPENRGFTGGNTAGVAAAAGDVLVFLNNDMRVEPDAVRHLVAALDGHTACVAARVLSWDGRHVDFVRGSVNFEARGFQDFYGLAADDPAATSVETFFPNGGAFAVTRDAYARAGGFDDQFFAYYDDVDLGWRLRITGSRLAVEERAVVYHRHGATSRAQPEGQKRFLMERNALVTVMKNYGERALAHVLAPALLLATRRLLDESRVSARARGAAALAPFSARLAAPYQASDVYVLGDDSRASVADDVLVGMPVEVLGALGSALESIPRVRAAHSALAAERRVRDADILPHFGRTFEAISPFSSYAAIQAALKDALDLPSLFRARTRLLIISHEALGTNMSGPAIRFLELGRALAATMRVTVASPGPAVLRDPQCTIAGYDPAQPLTLRRLAEDADVLFVQGFTIAQYPFLLELLAPIIVDLYCPFTIEHLEQTRAAAAAHAESPHAATQAADILAVQNAQLDIGDFFVCASEAQRDFWIGNLHSRGRINPRTYADDPTLRRLIDVVPFGLPGMDIRAWRGQPPVVKGVRPGIAAADTLLLWGGSLLDWQDPLTLIEAVALLAPERPDVKLFFMGTKHPNPLVAPMRVVEASRELARSRGLLDTHVFFNDWVPYEERARYLLEADLGLSTHREHLETHFSFRTRMLDYVWAGLPIVCTRGDVFARLVEERGLGLTVPPGDAASLADAIRRMLVEPERRQRASEQLRALARELEWRRVAAPLVRFCATPRHAADRALAVSAVRANLSRQYRVSKWLKRTALRAGISELRIEQVKRLGPVRALMAARNRMALRRAGAGDGSQ